MHRRTVMDATNDSEDSAVESGANGHSKTSLRSSVPYAGFPLPEGLRVAEAIQKAGGREATEPEVMAVMGLSSIQSHAWSYRISTAKEFGLIERVGRSDEAKLRVTDLFMMYAHPGSESEKHAALMQIVLKPTVYGPLLARYRGAPKPDVTGLSNVLMREHGIKETMRKKAAEAFLGTIEFAGLIVNGVVQGISNGVNGASAAPGREELPPPSIDEVKPPVETPRAAPGMQNVEVPDTFVVYTCKFGKGRFIKVPLPRDFTAADVDRLYAFLKTQVDDDDRGTP
jgi:hypothetical protein